MTAPDESYLTALAARQQTGTSPGKWDTCPNCPCGWHGLGCTTLVPSVGVTNVRCTCPSSWGGAA